MEFTIDRVRLHCDVFGEGEPVLFIHGFPLRGEMWHETVWRLAGWRCIVPDLRGHGRSEAVESVTIARFADDLAAILDELHEARPVVVCGLSMGGVIAFDFFRRHRPRVRALVLVDCRANAEDEEGRRRREELAEGVLRHGSRFVAEGLVDKVFAPGADPALKRLWHDHVSKTSPTGVAAAARALASRDDSIPTLGRIDVPTLLVFGEEDAITPPDVARGLHAAIPGARLEWIAGAGHLPPIERPAEFAVVLSDFLDSLGGRSPAGTSR